MPSLTRHEAETRAASVRVSAYEIDLDLTTGDQQFGSRTTVEFDSRDRQRTFLELRAAEVRSARLNGRPLDPEALREGRLRLDDLQEHNDLVVDAVMSYSHDGEGLHRSLDPEDGRAYVYAMSFLSAAPRVFGCFDQPDLKARYTVRARTPEDWTVLGNGRARQVQPGRWELSPTLPLSTYLVTLVAGPYHSILTEHDGIPLGLHCRQSLAAPLDRDAAELFEVTARCFDEYHRLFGIRYPFGEYHQCFVPEFNGGAMENPGCITLADELVFKAQPTRSLRAERANVIAHEMAHQWFGDLVTMRWWDDLWLNESFAEYMGHRLTHDVTPYKDIWLEFALARKAWGMAADQRSSTHPVAGNGAADAESALNDFDGISYAKGAASLRQLNSYLGDDTFIRGVSAYLREHSYGNATLADLLGAWQTASGKDVHAWSREWLRTEGVDTLEVQRSADGRLVIRRTNGSPSVASRPHAIRVTSYDDAGQAAHRRVVVHEERTPLDLNADDLLVLADSADESWAKIRLDGASTARAAELLRRVGDPVSRAVVWAALRESLTDGDLDPAHYLDVVVTALATETSDLIVERVLGTGGDGPGAVNLVGTYLDSAAHRDRLARLAADLLRSASAGSNRQLVAARAYVATSRDTDELGEWLRGGQPAGLRVDSEFRWRLTRALCSAGVADMDTIERERSADPSSQGAIFALGCEARLPDHEVKKRVWERIVSDRSLSNYELYELARRFFGVDDAELSGPYVERFFSDLPRTSEFRSGWVVEMSTALAFPRFAATPAILELAESALARDGLTAGVRRALSDRTDDLRRVVRSRQRFAG